MFLICHETEPAYVVENVFVKDKDLLDMQN